jgi:CRISPR-associated exonuclease Cas4
MFTEDQLLPISALQHLLFCERQCALIHVERLWAENRLTVEGQHLHARAHEGPDEYRQEVIVARSLTLRSTRLGLYGMADVVELYLNADSIRQRDESGKQRRRRLSAMLAGVKRAVPIEYKRGKPKKDDCDRVQLAAQAICLEEMFDISIEVGHLYYGERHRRHRRAATGDHGKGGRSSARDDSQSGNAARAKTAEVFTLLIDRSLLARGDSTGQGRESVCPPADDVQLDL